VIGTKERLDFRGMEILIFKLKVLRIKKP
jgi:hypothetical protein